VAFPRVQKEEGVFAVERRQPKIEGEMKAQESFNMQKENVKGVH